MSSDLPRRQTSRRRTNLHCRSALANFQEERRIPPGLHYFKSAGCCRTCNYGTYVQLSGTAPLILPHNRCTICEPFYRRRSLTESLVPRPVSPMPSTCHIQTWSRAGMQIGNAPSSLSSIFHELYDHTAKQRHHFLTQTSTRSRLDSHDAWLLQHRHDCSSTLWNNNIRILSSERNSPCHQFYIFHTHGSDTAVLRHHHQRACTLHRNTFPCIHHS